MWMPTTQLFFLLQSGDGEPRRSRDGAEDKKAAVPKVLAGGPGSPGLGLPWR